MAYLQQPNDLGTGLAAPEGHDVTANRFVQKSTLVLISLQARVTVRILVASTIQYASTHVGQDSCDQLTPGDG